jgi:hypothetical protein
MRTGRRLSELRAADARVMDRGGNQKAEVVASFESLYQRGLRHDSCIV